MAGSVSNSLIPFTCDTGEGLIPAPACPMPVPALVGSSLEPVRVGTLKRPRLTQSFLPGSYIGGTVWTAFVSPGPQTRDAAARGRRPVVRWLFAAEANPEERGGWGPNRKTLLERGPERHIVVSTIPPPVLTTARVIFSKLCSDHRLAFLSRPAPLQPHWNGTSPSSSRDRVLTLTTDPPLHPAPGQT